MIEFADENSAKLALDAALAFYDLDARYRAPALNCLQVISADPTLKQKFAAVYDVLYVQNTEAFRTLWQCQDVNTLLGAGVNPFVTNLMILLGAPVHQANLQKLGLDAAQVQIHRRRVRECFLNDLTNRGYPGIRVSQMLWASYFVNCRLLEIGILQYEVDHFNHRVKIHIPALPKLDLAQVHDSLRRAPAQIARYFPALDAATPYVCHSWLLSPDLTPLLKADANIRKFQALFAITPGADCVGDLLNHVYNIKDCADYHQLPTRTSLQTNIKRALLDGQPFRLGLGTLKRSH